MNASTINRRSFVAGAALAGAAVAAPAMPVYADEASAQAVDYAAPSFLDAPEPIADDEIAETLECDVVVCGLGIAGVAAARAAAEAGLTVIALEKCSAPSYRSSQYACFNTDNARAMGIADVDTCELVNELMVQTGHRADARVLKNWADHC